MYRTARSFSHTFKTAKAKNQKDTAHEHAFTTPATLTIIMKYSLAGVAGLAALAAAQGTWPADIVGTWSTKSNKTLTGPV
jgi:uncharacterized protein (DUF2147 family)